MARKLRIGFVGLGRVFDLNVRGYLDHPEAEIAALCESDPALLARRAAEHPDARATADFEGSCAPVSTWSRSSRRTRCTRR